MYMADISSYDYDAPLSEAGDTTPKYLQLRNVISEVCIALFFQKSKENSLH